MKAWLLGVWGITTMFGLGTGVLAQSTQRGSNAEVDCARDFDPSFCLENPIEPDNIFQIIDTIVTGAIGILIPLAVIMIIYGGLQFILARGNETKISAAKKTFTNIVIGVLLIVGATILIKIVIEVLRQL